MVERLADLAAGVYYGIQPNTFPHSPLLSAPPPFRSMRILAGDEGGRDNVMEGEANNRMGVYTSCTNVNKNRPRIGLKRMYH